MPELNAGDTAWLLMATALVMVMLPGLALFYGGLVRRKNVLSTIMHSFFGLALVSVVWVIVGFSLAFAPDVNGPGAHRRPRLRRLQRRGPRAQRAATARRIPFVLFASFQLMFAAITPALITAPSPSASASARSCCSRSSGRSSSTRRSRTGSGRRRLAVRAGRARLRRRHRRPHQLGRLGAGRGDAHRPARGRTATDASRTTCR